MVDLMVWEPREWIPLPGAIAESEELGGGKLLRFISRRTDVLVLQAIWVDF